MLNTGAAYGTAALSNGHLGLSVAFLGLLAVAAVASPGMLHTVINAA